MKKKYVFKKEKVPEGTPYAGLSQTTTKASGTTLTLKHLEKTMRYFRSKKYLKKVQEEEMMRAKGHQIALDALRDGKITEYEYALCVGSINMNGALVVNKEIYEKLAP